MRHHNASAFHPCHGQRPGVPNTACGGIGALSTLNHCDASNHSALTTLTTLTTSAASTSNSSWVSQRSLENFSFSINYLIHFRLNQSGPRCEEARPN